MKTLIIILGCLVNISMANASCSSDLRKAKRWVKSTEKIVDKANADIFKANEFAESGKNQKACRFYKKALSKDVKAYKKLMKAVYLTNDFDFNNCWSNESERLNSFASEKADRIYNRYHEVFFSRSYCAFGDFVMGDL
ncbi:MAG: hypothetical protein BM556_11620 [Bacteriovorax sp. MedPE-SWde]|nr:MAG: hypothetical protein BM556_11620 [Bacteriovorax sp. MedPE-SWde]